MSKITDENLIVERPHKSEYIGGVQRIYRLANGYGLSAVNGARLRSYPFAWEIAVVTNVRDDGDFSDLSYETPLTEDVEVFMTADAANEFIARAIQWGKENAN